MTVDVDMDDAGGVEKLQNVSTTSCNNVPQASTITTTSTIASGSAEVTVSADPYKDSIQVQCVFILFISAVVLSYYVVYLIR